MKVLFDQLWPRKKGNLIQFNKIWKLTKENKNGLVNI